MKRIILALALTSSSAVFAQSFSQCTAQCLVTNNLSRQSVVTIVSALGATLNEAKEQTKAKCSSTHTEKKQIIVSEILNETGNRFYSKTDTVLDSQCSSILL